MWVSPFLFELKTGKEKDPKKDSFAEKMAAQIIKNLQIQILNIHVRYEDAYTNPKHPFSIGVSLAELLFQVQRFSRARGHQLDELSKCLNVVILSITHETIDDETDFVRLILGFFFRQQMKTGSHVW